MRRSNWENDGGWWQTNQAATQKFVSKPPSISEPPSRCVDRTVEPLVREIFNSVTTADEERFSRALQAVPADKTRSAADLALAIDRMAMVDLHPGIPSDERVRYLTETFHADQGWSRPEGLPVEDFFRSIAGLPADPVGDDVTGLLAFLVGGWLLVAFLKSVAHWYNYLDDILDRLDAEF
jgi:hypothetical protein